MVAASLTMNWNIASTIVAPWLLTALTRNPSSNKESLFALSLSLLSIQWHQRKKYVFHQLQNAMSKCLESIQVSDSSTRELHSELDNLYEGQVALRKMCRKLVKNQASSEAFIISVRASCNITRRRHRNHFPPQNCSITLFSRISMNSKRFMYRN
jgi:hypothetical protein